MVYLIYLGVAALIVWSVWYVCHAVRRQLRGDCSGGCVGCAAHSGCPGCDAGKPPRGGENGKTKEE